MARAKSNSNLNLLCWEICMSIRKSNPKKHKAMFKDLMKLEEDKYYPKKKGKNGKHTKRNH